jgi:hypothetical protein
MNFGWLFRFLLFGPADKLKLEKLNGN